MVVIEKNNLKYNLRLLCTKEVVHIKWLQIKKVLFFIVSEYLECIYKNSFFANEQSPKQIQTTALDK